jgi:hypothetical protein
MQRVLEQLLDAEEASGSPVRQYLRPGLPLSVVRDRLEAIGLRAPAELLDLYAYCDGIDQSAWRHASHGNTILDLLPHFELASLDESIVDYVDLKETSESMDAAGWGNWQPDFFPVLRAEKWRYAIACNGGAHGPMWAVYTEPWPPTVRRYDSLSALIAAATARFARGNYAWSTDRSCFVRKAGSEL